MTIDINDIRRATNNDGSVVAIDLIIEKLEEIDERLAAIEYKIQQAEAENRL